MELKHLFQVYLACKVLIHFGFRCPIVDNFIMLYDLYHQSSSNVCLSDFDKFFNV